MDKSTYLEPLGELRDRMESAADTPYNRYAKVLTLIVMNMRYERVAFARDLPEHPYALAGKIVRDAIAQFRAFLEIAFVEGGARGAEERKSPEKERKHRDLFNEVWDRYGEADFRRYIDRYVHRVRVNRLDPLVRGARCLDLGCGNGNFCFALLECGAAAAAGIDYGEKSIAYATEYARRQGLAGRAEFRQATVYETGFPPDSFDFAIQNGVFHHLDDEERAVREVRRVLKPGGWFWYYTDGEGGISYDLWDASVAMLRDVPVRFIEEVLNAMNVSRDKTVHIMDGLSATYAHTSWDKATEMLARHGFGNFRRLTGGFDTDFDLDRIESDPYGREKFGEGDLRILCQLLGK